ncbi:putative late blight resistance proteinR1B-16 [Sesamum angolense]|uniref:Late blight resistance proteinR1B-16 n=1 Tax=Sesamum angolense TaxID=2727404 RepID=A0AAE2BRH4_9LAMI|nr:putative late blight resistance proteinR1B-16 [Sesamum angolense]
MDLIKNEKHAMVGVDDVLNDIMDKLTGQQSGCRIIPIVGMGGICKTALARNVYENPLIVQYFDTCAWVTVSQEYNTREILLELVCPESKRAKEMLSGEELGEMLYRSLCGRRLRKLWIAERFLKPISGKSLEEVAGEYLKDLIDRNLIIAHRSGSSGKIRSCKMHDLLRDLCLREAQKEKFLCSLEIGQAKTIHRRIVEAFPLDSLRLLRVLKQTYSEDLHYLRRKDWYPIEAIFKLVNLQYLAFSAGMNLGSSFPSSMHLLWNLQTLIVKRTDGQLIYAPPEIWKMHQLRHVQVPGLGLPDPPTTTATGDEFVLSNLQKMSQIKNFKCAETVVERIPNIRKLHIFYSESSISQYCPENLGYLQTGIPLCSLPLLQGLKLYNDSVKGGTWNTVEGQFCSLRFLQMTCIYKLKRWRVDSSHFPCLNVLRLVELRKLEKIPSSFGEIQIELYMCRDSAVISAKTIAEQQEEFGNHDFRVVVWVEPNSELKSFATHNFHVFSSG